MGAAIARRRAKQLESFGTVKYPNYEEVRKALNISESEFKFLPYFENSLGVVLGA